MIFTRGSATTEGPHEHAMSLKISSINAKPYKRNAIYKLAMANDPQGHTRLLVSVSVDRPHMIFCQSSVAYVAKSHHSLDIERHLHVFAKILGSQVILNAFC